MIPSILLNAGGCPDGGIGWVSNLFGSDGVGCSCGAAARAVRIGEGAGVPELVEFRLVDGSTVLVQAESGDGEPAGPAMRGLRDRFGGGVTTSFHTSFPYAPVDIRCCRALRASVGVR